LMTHYIMSTKSGILSHLPTIVGKVLYLALPRQQMI
jgi:hypothetical protein